MTSLNSTVQTLGSPMIRWLALTLAFAAAPLAAQAQSLPVSEQLSPAGDAQALPEIGRAHV